MLTENFPDRSNLPNTQKEHCVQQDKDRQELVLSEEFLEAAAAEAPVEELPHYLQNIKGIRGSRPTEANGNTLRVAVECHNLEMLEHLWNDYCSGHLNSVAEKCLLTDDIKRRFHVESVKFRTTILEDDYLACKEFLLNRTRKLMITLDSVL